jgi:hypothetical protein
MSFAIVLGQFSYIYNLGETGCYNYIPFSLMYPFISRINGLGANMLINFDGNLVDKNMERITHTLSGINREIVMECH